MATRKDNKDKSGMSAQLQDKGPVEEITTPNSGECAIIPFGEARDYYLSKRHALLMELAALDKMLGLKRKCKRCGNEA